MKNKRGFTLIELLAVIVILAIIALIAVPIILNMINEARKNAAKSSALGYVDAIENNNGFAQLGSDASLDEVYNPVVTGNVSDATTALGSHLKGKAPTSGTITVNDKGKVTSADLCFSGYKVVYDGKDVTSVTKGCSGSGGGSSTESICPGCVFAYPTNVINVGESTVPSNATDDYTTILADHPVFVGLIANSNTGIIERAFSCSKEGTTVYCIEGNKSSLWSNGTTASKLNTIFPNCNASSNDSSATCSGNSSITVTAQSDGYVAVRYEDTNYNYDQCIIAEYENTILCEDYLD